jgi:hypothetical protein
VRNRKDVDGGGGGGEFESVDAEEINIDRTATGNCHCGAPQSKLP